jgi:hypothetical protein
MWEKQATDEITTSLRKQRTVDNESLPEPGGSSGW